MAKTIHESMQNLDLFNPLANSIFSVDSAGAFNYDQSLVFNPTTNDMRAFVKAPTMAKNIFKQRTYDWSFSCWIKLPGNANQSGPLFVVQNNDATGSMNANMPLYIDWGMINGTYMGIQYYGAAGNVSVNRSHNTTGVWTFFVFLIPQPGIAVKSFMGRADVGTPDASFTSHANVATGTDVYNSNLRCALGRYGDSSPTNSMFTNVNIAKLTFHDRLLTLAECQAMYYAMVTPTNPQTPLYAEYDASVTSSVHSTSGRVDQWDDISGNGRHLISTGSLRPFTGRTLNGLDVIDFQGAQYMSLIGSLAIPIDYCTVLVVGGTDTTTSDYRGLLSLYNGTNDYDNTSSFSLNVGDGSNHLRFECGSSSVNLTGTGQTPIGTHIFRKGTATNDVDIISSGGGTASGTIGYTGTAISLVVGGRNVGGLNTTYSLDGPIGHIKIFRGRMTTANRTTARNASIAKWGA